MEKRHFLAATLLLAAALPARGAKVPDPRDLSVEELVGQTFMIAIDTEIAVSREADVRAGRLGGGMLRWDKFTGAQALEMTGKLRKWSKESPHHIPFWVSTDHEGGPTFTQRLYGIAPFPGSMALGSAASPELAHDVAEATARELRALGIDVTFAPSLDVNSNPANPIIGLRSYGEDPALVTELGLAALKGYRDGGILAVPKHFPGHGDTSEDSHLGLPVNKKPLAELEKTELPPFRAAIRDGAEAIMPAHMVFPALGAADGRPNTLSSEVLEGFLRGTLGFKGLIFSDSLDMGAILNVYGSSESAVLALLAGNDVLLIGKGDYPAAFAAVVDAVRSGRIPRKRVEESVARILEAKRRLGLFSFSEPKPLKANALAADRALAQRAADEAVTLVWNQGLVPLKLRPAQRLSLVIFHTGRYAEEASRWAADVARRHPETEVFDLPVSPSSAAIAGVLARTRASAAVVAGTFQYGYAVPAPQAELLRDLIAGPAPVAEVSLMNPYDLALASGARAGIAAYGMTDSALEATAKLLFGEIPFGGHLPVTVPGLPSESVSFDEWPPSPSTAAYVRPLDKPISLEFTGGSLRDLLTEVHEKTNLDFTLVQGLGDCRVAAFVRDISARALLRMLVATGREINFQSAGRPDHYRIARVRGGPVCPPKPNKPPPKSCTPDGAGLKCEGGSLASLARVLHAQTGDNVLVWNEAIDRPVTVKTAQPKTEDVLKTLQTGSNVSFHPGAEKSYVIYLKVPVAASYAGSERTDDIGRAP